jgi:hypothetical protein
VFEPVKCAPRRGLGELTAIHLHQVAGAAKAWVIAGIPAPTSGRGAGGRGREGRRCRAATCWRATWYCYWRSV